MPNSLRVTLLASLLTVTAAAADIELLYSGPEHGTALRGVQLGLDESNRQGEFLGIKLVLARAAPHSLPARAVAILLDRPGAVRELAARAGDRAVLNLSDGSDSLREACLPNVLHVIPSERMKADAVAQWRSRNADAKVSAAAWHGEAVKFAARDLNKRYRNRFESAMDELAWAGWFAVRAVADTLMRNPAADGAALVGLLKAADGFDGQKGDPQSFRASGQLRQPLVLVGPSGALLGEAPVRGGLDRFGQSRGCPLRVNLMLRLLPASLLLAFPGLLAAEPTHRLFVTNEADDSVTVIASRSGEVEETIAVGGRPRGIGFSPDRKHVYVALGDDNAIGVIDASSLEVVRKIPAGSDPEAFAVHPNGTIYLSNEDEGLASVLDPASGKILAEIKVGLEPEGVGVSPDGQQVLVTSESSNMVHVISVAENRLVANVLVGARPREVAFSPDGKFFWVTSEVAGHVSKVDRATNRVAAVNDKLRREINPRVKPKGILLSPDGTRLYVSLGRGNAIAVLAPDTLELRGSVEVGVRVWGLALSRDGRRLYAANGPDGNVSVVDTEAMREIAKIPTGAMPWGVVLDD